MLLNRPTPQIYSLFWCHNTPHNSGRRSNLFLPSSPGCQPIIPLALQNVFRAVRQHAYVPMDIIQIIAFHPSVFGRNKSVGANIVGGCAIRLFRNHVLPVPNVGRGFPVHCFALAQVNYICRLTQNSLQYKRDRKIFLSLFSPRNMSLLYYCCK